MSVGAARLLCAAGCRALLAAPAFGQTAPLPPSEPGELDPTRRLRRCRIWASIGRSSTPRTLHLRRRTRPSGKAQPTEAAGTVRYTLEVDGLSSIGNGEELIAAFRKQSTLEAERKDAGQCRADRPPRERRRRPSRPNCCAARAITTRRSSRGPSGSGDALRVILTPNPALNTASPRSSCPGLNEAGAEAGKLRDVFAVKAGDPVIAAGRDCRRRCADRRRSASRALPRPRSASRTSRSITRPISRPCRCRSIPGRSRASARSASAAVRRSARAMSGSSRGSGRRPVPALEARRSAARADRDDPGRERQHQLVPVQGGRVVDVDVQLEPAPSHTIAGEIGYGTGQGA